LRFSERLQIFGAVLRIETCSDAAGARMLLDDLRTARNRYGLTDTEAALMSALAGELCAWNYHNALLKELRQLSLSDLRSRAEQHGIRLDFSLPVEESLQATNDFRDALTVLLKIRATMRKLLES
jgi:hypothetical protein